MIKEEKQVDLDAIIKEHCQWLLAPSMIDFGQDFKRAMTEACTQILAIAAEEAELDLIKDYKTCTVSDTSITNCIKFIKP